MSIIEKGIRGGTYYGAGPHRVSSGVGEIWQDAPRSSLEQGKMIIFAPDLSQVVDGTLDAARVAGATDAVSVGGYGAVLTLVDSGLDALEVFKSSGGRMIMTTNNANNDNVSICFQGGGTTGSSSMKGLPFMPVAGSTIRFGIKAKMDDSTNADFWLGLFAADGSLDAVSESIHFEKDQLQTQPSLILENGSVETELLLTDDAGDAVAVADDTYFEAGFVVNGVTSVTAYWNGARNHQTTVTNLPTTVPLTVALQIQAAENATQTLTVERLVCTQTMV